MPTYSFECNCGYKKEELLKISERNSVMPCPKCSGIMHRCIGTSSGFYLKGKGFYKQGWNLSKGGNQS